MGDVGSKLRSAREKKGLSLEEVYQKTRIHPKVLEALEEDRTEPYLGKPYVKGFLKSYATLLGLDGEGLVQDYFNGLPPKQAMTPLSPSLDLLLEGEEEGGLSPWSRRAITAILLLGLLYGIGLGFSKVNWSGKDFFERYPLAAKETFQKFDRSFRIPEAQPLHLEISARVNAWVMVKADDRLVYQGLLTAGQQESWNAQHRLGLSLGEGGTVVLELNRHRLGIPGERGKALEGLTLTREGVGIEKPL